ncbi:unnamed protein product [Effrenium voratum]|uniref:Uncharacterized protein n=1 Tax=Effrenium voratum TaxID=2562239 RepID=A0AA36MSZ8_9DINO|nr:unnamed protein product [Effrenium voratum]
MEYGPVRSKMSDRARAMCAAANAAVAEHDRVDKLFKRSCHDVDAHLFADVEGFPLNAVGDLVWFDLDERSKIERLIVRLLRYDKAHSGGRAPDVWHCLLSSVYPFMTSWGIDKMLLALVLRTLHNRAKGRCWVQYIEYACGRGNLSKAALRRGLRGVSFDKIYSSSHDVLTIAGLRLWLLALAASLPKCLVWHGTQCSSFVTLSLSQSLRYKENDWLGDQDKLFVKVGNMLADITGLTMCLAFLMDGVEVLEQPLNSRMPLTPCLRAALVFTCAQKITTYHSCFGGETLKPLQLWSSCSMMTALARDRPIVMRSDAVLARRDKNGGFTGVKHLLLESQAYTLQFGDAVISALLSSSS